MASDITPIKIKSITPLHDWVIVSDMNFKNRFTAGGIALLSDDGKLEGIHARWGKVYSVGPEQKDVKVGQWILVSHGRWTNGVRIDDGSDEIKTLRRVDNNDILAVSDTEVLDENMGQPL